MEQLQTHHKWTIPVLILALLLLLIAVLMASGHQVSLPLTGIQSNRQVMPTFRTRFRVNNSFARWR